MGHDITAYDDRGGEIAYLRRNAGNPLARVIYIALDVQSCDCGCSGSGDRMSFDKDQLESALMFCEEHEAELEQIEGMPYEFKSLMQSMERMGATVVHDGGGTPPSINREKQFLFDCLTHCRVNEVKSVVIHFC